MIRDLEKAGKTVKKQKGREKCLIFNILSFWQRSILTEKQ